MERRAFEEPAVADMLRDPVVQAVMARDGVRPEEVMRLMAAVRERLALGAPAGRERDRAA
jgi:hypothetical protein